MVHLVEALCLLLEERGLLVDELLLRQLPRHQLLDQDRLRRLCHRSVSRCRSYSL